ncbi:MAG: general secretion pathway protein GspB [Candidatus Thiodiazotropha sp.]
MSSILEALEKAEGERIRTAATGLGPTRRKRTGPRFSLPVIVGIVTALLLLNLAIWWFYLRVVPDEPTTPSSAASGPAKPIPAAVPQPQPQRVKEAVKPALSLRDQLKRNAAPSDKPLIDEAQVTLKPPPPPPPAAVVRPAPSSRQVVPPVREPVRVDQAVAEPAAGVVSRAASGSDVAPIVRPEPVVVASPRPAPTAQPVEQPPEEQIPLVWELPQTLREKVLGLKSSVHVYNETPAQRFVIINMHRYSEGDSLPPDGFRLERIDRDGVVIDYGAGQVRLPRR